MRNEIFFSDVLLIFSRKKKLENMRAKKFVVEIDSSFIFLLLPSLYRLKWMWKFCIAVSAWIWFTHKYFLLSVLVHPRDHQTLFFIWKIKTFPSSHFYVIRRWPRFYGSKSVHFFLAQVHILRLCRKYFTIKFTWFSLFLLYARRLCCKIYSIIFINFTRAKPNWFFIFIRFDCRSKFSQRYVHEKKISD